MEARLIPRQPWRVVMRTVCERSGKVTGEKKSASRSCAYRLACNGLVAQRVRLRPKRHQRCPPGTLTDHQGNPLANVNVTLFLYQLGEGKALAVPMESSRTEEEGRCQLLLPADAPRDQSGFFRGYLVIEDYGNRSLLWPGGVLTVNVWLNAAGRGLDIAGHPPYDWQKPDADPVAVEVLSTPRSQVGKVAAVLVIVGVWLGIVLWRAR